MIPKIINGALKNRGLVLVALIGVVALGVVEYKKLDVEAFPDISPVMVPIFAEPDGMAPEEVEQLITYPIETAMNGLPNVTLIKSTSAFGMAVIYVYFSDDTDIYFARQLVAERLAAASADLPEMHDAPTLGPISTGLGQIFLYYLELEEGADTGGLDELTYLRDINDWVVKRQLQTISGVTDILSAGGHVLQYQIKLDPYLLHQYDLAVEDVVTAVQLNNRVIPAGSLDNGYGSFSVKVPGLFEKASDVYNLAIKSSGDGVVVLSDIAEIRRTFKDRVSYASVNTKPGYGLAISKRVGENVIETTAEVRRVLGELSKTWPDTVQVSYQFDSSRTRMRRHLGMFKLNVYTATEAVAIFTNASSEKRDTRPRNRSFTWGWVTPQ